MEKFETDYTQHLKTGEVSVYNIYLAVISDIGQYFGLRVNEGRILSKEVKSISPTALAKFSLLSSKLIVLERRQKEWRSLQFLHISNFPKTECSYCKESLCFACGESPFHENQTCMDFMKTRVRSCGSGGGGGCRSEDDEKNANRKWKLENSKRCPQCSILINRDEGCNKVECVYCGHSFCWNCEGRFDNGNCSYYRCQLGDKSASVKEGEKNLNAALSINTSSSASSAAKVKNERRIFTQHIYSHSHIFSMRMVCRMLVGSLQDCQCLNNHSLVEVPVLTKPSQPHKQSPLTHCSSDAYLPIRKNICFCAVPIFL